MVKAVVIQVYVTDREAAVSLPGWKPKLKIVPKFRLRTRCRGCHNVRVLCLNISEWNAKLPMNTELDRSK